jgi:hypothetical protein
MPSALRGKNRTIPLQMLARQTTGAGGQSVSVETKQEPYKLMPIAEYFEPTQNLVYSSNRYQRKQVKLTGVSVNSALVTGTNPFVFKCTVKKKVTIEFECVIILVAGVSDITTVIRITNATYGRDIAVCTVPVAVDATHERYFATVDLWLNADDEVSAYVNAYNSSVSSKTLVITDAVVRVIELL